MGVAFTIVPSDLTEYLDHARPVEEIAIELALGKARAVAEQHPGAIVIGADTIVLHDGKQLGKPKNKAEARKTLHTLAGGKNQVCTGLAVLCPELQFEAVQAVTSSVILSPPMRRLSKPTSPAVTGTTKPVRTPYKAAPLRLSPVSKGHTTTSSVYPQKRWRIFCAN